MDKIEQAREARTLADVVATIEAGEFYADYNQSVADLGILRAALSRPVEGEPVDYEWKCNNCTTVFRSKQQARRANDTNGGPTCPHCKAFGQYTYRNDLHFGDPCVKCGIPHDEVLVGPCIPLTAPPVADSEVLRERVAEPRRIRCRDCADADGTCPTTGQPCDPEARLAQAERNGPCTLGMGCDDYGFCYADHNGRPDMCGRGQAEGGPAVTEAQIAAAYRAVDLAGEDNPYGIFRRGYQAALHPQSAAGEEGKP